MRIRLSNGGIVLKSDNYLQTSTVTPIRGTSGSSKLAIINQVLISSAPAITVPSCFHPSALTIALRHGGPNSFVFTFDVIFPSTGQASFFAAIKGCSNPGSWSAAASFGGFSFLGAYAMGLASSFTLRFRSVQSNRAAALAGF